MKGYEKKKNLKNKKALVFQVTYLTQVAVEKHAFGNTLNNNNFRFIQKLADIEKSGLFQTEEIVM